MGSLEKRLEVFGNRYWQGRRPPTTPEPFVEMPITWQNAFGGEGFDNNPLGKGFAPIETDDGKVHPLPNVELPRKLVKSKRDRPDPASFGPIDLMWPQRFGKAGTHDANWLKAHFPGFAADMDWSIFNLATEDQQQTEPFRGDEQFVIEGMHPAKPQLVGQLPSMATRCFVNQRAGDDEAFREVTMRLTTAWFFPHAERYLLVFHGVHEIAEDDAADILQLMIGAEELGQPKSIEHYQDVLTHRLDPEKGAIYALRDADLLPTAPEINAAEDAEIAEMTSLLQMEGLRPKYQREKANREIEEARAFVASLGLDPDLHAPSPLPPEPPLPSLEELPEFEQRVKAEVEHQIEASKAEQAKRDEALRELLVAEGLDADAILSEPEQPVIGPPQFSAEEEIEKLRTLSAECVAMGCPVEELDVYATDPERRKMTFHAEQSIRDGYRQTAHHQAAPPRLEGDAAARSRQRFLDAVHSRTGVVHVDFTGADLEGLDLHGADLHRAWLENANLARANLEGANLSEAVLSRADLTEANLTGANLTKANLGLAQIVRTKADGAILSEAILNKATFDGASVRDAKLDSSDLTEARYSATDMSGALLGATPFLKSDLRGLCLAGADLSQCTFLEADVSGVDFRGAHLEKVNFVKCKGAGAIFRKPTWQRPALSRNAYLRAPTSAKRPLTARAYAVRNSPIATFPRRGLPGRTSANATLKGRNSSGPLPEGRFSSRAVSPGQRLPTPT